MTMASRPKQATARPAPRLYLVTPPVADASAISPQLASGLEAGDIAAVLLRFVEVDERTLINCAKALATPCKARVAHFCLKVAPVSSHVQAPTARI